MIHEDILKRMALAVGNDPTELLEPWPPLSILFEVEDGALLTRPPTAPAA